MEEMNREGEDIGGAGIGRGGSEIYVHILMTHSIGYFNLNPITHDKYIHSLMYVAHLCYTVKGV